MPTTFPARAAFRNPNFRYYLAARFLAAIATEMQALAVAWQVYGLTRRPLDLGLVGLAQFLPGILLFLLSGHVADRLPRQRILQACALGFSVCSLLLIVFTLRGLTVTYPIYLAVLWNGVVRAFNGPASQAFLPLLVPAQEFPTAVAWAASTFQGATILGPLAGGLVYGATGSPLAVYCCAAAGYLVAFALFAAVRPRAVERAPSGRSLRMVFDGFHYLWRNKLILGAISLDLFAVLLGGAVALLPVYAREILQVGATGLGILRGAPGMGAIATAAVVAVWPVRRRAGTILLFCVLGFGLFTVVFALSRNLALSVAALFLVGACDMVSVVIRHTLVQLGTPDEMRGRVSAVNSVFIGASNEVGQFESGITAQWFGAVPAVVIGGVGTIAVVLLWGWLFPDLRRADKLST
jgi:MFS family permease